MPNLLTSSVPDPAFEEITDFTGYKHYPASRRYDPRIVYFSADEFENNVYTDFEQNINQAIYFAKLYARSLVAAKTSSNDADIIGSGTSSGDKDVKSGREYVKKTIYVATSSRKDGRPGFWATLNHRYEANVLQRKSVIEPVEDRVQHKPASRRSSIGERPHIISTSSSSSSDLSDSSCAGEILSREERALIRKAKCDAMRTRRPIDPVDECKFLQLRLDSPFTDPIEPMQPKASWQHEQLKLENEERIREKALDFKYCLRMSLKADGRGDRKSCLVSKSEVGCQVGGNKTVRFGGVHEDKKVRWVDVEHVADLAKPQHEEWRNAF